MNFAARVCGQARAGELLVTDPVRALTQTLLPVRFTDRRTRRLTGIPEVCRTPAPDAAVLGSWAAADPTMCPA